MQTLRTAIVIGASALFAFRVAAAADTVPEPRTPTDAHCLPSEEPVFPDTADPELDYDCDGWPKTEDCDDYNGNIHPEAVEYNNGIDDNCDGIAPPLYGCGVTSYDAAWMALVPVLWRQLRRRPTVGRLTSAEAST
jgi:hypothetical protein